MSEEILNETVEETTETIEIPQRVNPFCVISKEPQGEYAVHDIQTNASWGANPYGDTYAVVPDDMVEGILATKGFVDIVLNDEGTDVVSFTALEVPDIPEEEPQPSLEEQIAELRAQNEMLTTCLLEMSEYVYA